MPPQQPNFPTLPLPLSVSVAGQGHRPLGRQPAAHRCAVPPHRGVSRASVSTPSMDTDPPVTRDFPQVDFTTPVQPRKQESQPGVSLAPSRPLSMLEIIPPTRFVRHQPLPSAPGGILPRLRKTVVGHRFRLRISEFPPCHFSHFELSELRGVQMSWQVFQPTGRTYRNGPLGVKPTRVFWCALGQGLLFRWTPPQKGGSSPPTSLFSSPGITLPKEIPAFLPTEINREKLKVGKDHANFVISWVSFLHQKVKLMVQIVVFFKENIP